jgi:hypothetical protein
MPPHTRCPICEDQLPLHQCYVVVLRDTVQGKPPSRKFCLELVYIVDDDLMARPLHRGIAVDDLRVQDGVQYLATLFDGIFLYPYLVFD